MKKMSKKAFCEEFSDEFAKIFVDVFVLKHKKPKNYDEYCDDFMISLSTSKLKSNELLKAKVVSMVEDK